MMLEKDLEAKLVREVKAMGGMCLKWVCPGNRGVPDRIALLPGGRVVFIEMKRPKGSRVDPLQAYWGRVLTGLGFKTYIISTPEELRIAIKAFKEE